MAAGYSKRPSFSPVHPGAPGRAFHRQGRNEVRDAKNNEAHGAMNKERQSVRAGESVSWQSPISSCCGRARGSRRAE